MLSGSERRRVQDNINNRIGQIEALQDTVRALNGRLERLREARNRMLSTMQETGQMTSHFSRVPQRTGGRWRGRRQNGMETRLHSAVGAWKREQNAHSQNEGLISSTIARLEAERGSVSMQIVRLGNEVSHFRNLLSGR